jgi:hypothetical protein
MTGNNKLIIGWREWVVLPELGIPAVKAKIDTGARTSALDTFTLETFKKGGKLKVRFGVHPIRRRPDIEIFCVADVVDQRLVSDSGGHRERRLVIRTPVRMGEMEWPIEITLTNRESMRFRMLIGRLALNERLLVDTDASYLMGDLGHLLYTSWQLKSEG